MNSQTLLDNFATIADAPGGVQRLRRLVLDLAVRGLIVEQNHGEEGHAEDLLALISQHSLVSNSKLTEPLGADDGAWDLPPTWRWARLKQIADFSAGRTPPTKDSSYWSDGEGHAWVAIGDMPEGGEVSTTKRKVTDKAVGEIFGKEPDPPGTLLMSFKLTIGKVARLSVPAFHNEAIISITTPFEPIGEYLFRTLPFLAQGGASKAAIMGNTLNKASLTNLPVPVPPLVEQGRIVAKIDELMGLCDDLEGRQKDRHLATSRLRASALDVLTKAGTLDDRRREWKRVDARWAELIEDEDGPVDLRRAVVTLLTSGTLSDQRLEDGTAAELVERAHKERATMRSTKPKGAQPLEAQPYDLPPSWEWVRLGQLTVGMRYGSAARSEPSGDVPVLRMGNLQSGTIDWTDLKFTSDPIEIEKYLLPTPSVLFNRTNSPELVGKTAIYRGERPAAFAGYLIHLIPVEGLEPEYLNLVLNTPFARSWCSRVRVDGISQSNISASKLAAFPFPLPPMREQQRIVEISGDFDRLLNQLVERINNRQIRQIDFASSLQYS